MILPLLSSLLLMGCEPDSLIINNCLPNRAIYHNPDSVTLLLNNPDIQELGNPYSVINDCVTFPPNSPNTCKKKEVRMEGDCLCIPVFVTGGISKLGRIIWDITTRIDSTEESKVVSIILFGKHYFGTVAEILFDGEWRLDLGAVKKQISQYQSGIMVDVRFYRSDIRRELYYHFE